MRFWRGFGDVGGVGGLGFGLAPGLAALALGLATLPDARADVPFPTCADAGCSDPADFASYLFIEPGALPNDYFPDWKYEPDTGMDIVQAWERTTGRPDVRMAVLDSGIRWSEFDVTNTVWLNTGELPVAPGCAEQDCNGDGFVSTADYASACDANGCNGGELIALFSDGVDDDGNGFVDDIAGWDFVENDNDPFDDVDYGHGTGEAKDQVAEANNGSGEPGFAPSSFFLPLRVGDSFVSVDQPFAQAVVYAVDRGVDFISEALGTVNASVSGQAAVDYAYRRGIPIIASAADEESRHHNYPAAYGHMIWVNSVKNGDGLLLDEDGNGYDLLNGCTNYGGKAWVAIPSSACSSEATGRAGGLTALLISHAKNQIDRGLFTPYPGTGTPLSAEEVRQLLRVSARDVDYSDAPFAVPTIEGNLISALLSAPALGLYFGSSRYPTQPEWDQFTGYGRPNAPDLLDLVTDSTIPPEVDLSGSIDWFDIVDPVREPATPVRASLRALRAGNAFDWTLEVGCGIQPLTYTEIASGSSTNAIEAEVLTNWVSGDSATACGFDPTLPVTGPDVDAHTVTLRLRAIDAFGNLGEDRRSVAVHSDPTLRFAPIDMPGSGESGPALTDVNRDGVLDIVHGGGDGSIHVISGATGANLPGFPTYTDAIAVHASPAFASGEVPVPHEAVIGAIAADDLDGDGRIEIVAASFQGRLYAFDDHGGVRDGFPVSVDPSLSLPENRDRLNDQLRGFAGAPVLVDLDAPGEDPALEILASALDGNLYAWHADGSSVSGYPVRLADRARVSIDDATGKATPLAGFDVRDRAAKSLSSPAVGDFDGDGRPEIVVATNEEYGNEPNSFAVESNLLRNLQLLLASADVDEFSLDTNGRVYALHPDGNDHPGGPYLPGWPVKVPLLTPGVLPTVGTGVPGSAAITDIDGAGSIRIAIFGMIGPVVLLKPDGTPSLGTITNLPRVLAVDFPGRGFPTVPATAGSPDAPFFGALGSGAFGDITGDGLPEYVAPTGGLRKLLDVVAPAQQGQLPDADSFVEDGVLAHHQLTAWNPRTGVLEPAFPRVMEDMQFIGSPALADVDGDGVAEAINGSGAYLVRAYRSDGAEPEGWPKFTHGWHIGAPTPGDVDGDGLNEVVIISREGKLFIWDTPAPATEAGLPWQGFGRDRRNTKNGQSGVSSLAGDVDPLAGLGWELEQILDDIETLASQLTHPESTLLRGSPAPFLIPQTIAYIDQSRDFDTAKTLNGIEWGLRLPPRPIAGLAPLHARFVAAVRATLVREIAAADCAPADTVCKTKLMQANFFLATGDGQLAANPRASVFYWATGIARF